MAKDKIKIIKSSPEGTPDDEVIYVLELPTTSRIKFRKKDLEKEVLQIDTEITHKEKRKAELQDILTETNKLI